MAARDGWTATANGDGYTDEFTVAAGATTDVLIYGGYVPTITGIPGDGGKWSVKMANSEDPDNPGADDFVDSGHGDMSQKRMINAPYGAGLTVIRLGAERAALTVRATMV